MNVSLFLCDYTKHFLCVTHCILDPKLKEKLCALLVVPPLFASRPLRQCQGCCLPVTELTHGLLGACSSSWSGVGGEGMFKALCLGQDRVISGETAELSRSQP